ncbi:MAG: ribosomal protein S18-alanine N-acetyltransferase [Myxococcota bacterium]
MTEHGKGPPSGFLLRPMTVGDLDDVVEIDRLSYPKSWTRGLFERELRCTWSRITVAAKQPADRPHAHAVYWIVHDELHLLNIAVHPQARGHGLARALMHHMLAVCAQNQLVSMTLEVRVSNAPAIGLYRAFGFTTIGHREGYYADNKEDALVMGLMLEPASLPHVPPSDVQP